jgi:predicted acyltransferase
MMEEKEKQPSVQKRLLSLDVLRGFDMLWIIGGGSLLIRAAEVSNTGWLNSLAEQMHHVPWEGFRFYDLIFPLFMFISGVAIPFALWSKKQKAISDQKLMLKAFRRMILLIILGLLYNGIFWVGFEKARYASVLGQIGVAYFFTFLIYILTKKNLTRIYFLSGMLLLVAVLQLFIPVPGIGAGVLTPEGCMNGYIDRMFLPGRLGYGPEGLVKEGGIYDPLGILCIVSATGITLMGALAGSLLQNEKFSEYKKTKILSALGVGLIVAALAVSPVYPIIKNCWTSSYNLLAGGISLLLLALFYLIIDVWNYRKWTFVFMVIGMNSLFIYLVKSIVPSDSIVEKFVGFLINSAGDYGAILKTTGILTFDWLLLYFLYKRKVFIRV